MPYKLPYNRQCGSVYQNYKDISFDLAVSHKQIYPTDGASFIVHSAMWTRLFTAASFEIAK